MDHGFKISIRSELWIKLDVTDDIISVRTSRPRFEVWRSVDVADAEFREVRRDRGGLFEAKVLCELQPVGCPGDRWLMLLCQWALRLANARIEWLRFASGPAHLRARFLTRVNIFGASSGALLTSQER